VPEREDRFAQGGKRKRGGERAVEGEEEESLDEEEEEEVDAEEPVSRAVSSADDSTSAADVCADRFFAAIRGHSETTSSRNSGAWSREGQPDDRDRGRRVG
jgi:hypothetical protein